MYKASIECSDFSFFSKTYLFPVMKVGHCADIFTTEMLLTLGSQAVCWKDRKQSQCLKRKQSKERGLSLMDGLIHGLLILGFKTF